MRESRLFIAPLIILDFRPFILDFHTIIILSFYATFNHFGYLYNDIVFFQVFKGANR